ncbi:hypothetical protein EB796_000855 [Bugula neritina]|uniref:HSBP1 n=1 Tax=Bugula neritina TaxID=10212 RepID=A0A7J7KRS4_BUGNE|nr:hypothetical protein EB796_022814 [Bugula neritina]KAF6040839.1 hypothetical protein EB796_000855 [Bugula neritina]
MSDMDVMTPAEANPQNVQDLTLFVQTILQQMQDKFKTMSDQIITRHILFKLEIYLFCVLTLRQLKC